MANIASKWLTYNPENVHELRQRCVELCDKKGMNQKLLAYEAGGWDPSYFSKWLRNGCTDLPADRYHKLLAFVANTGIIKAEDYDKVFAAIADFLGYSQDDTIKQAVHFVGHYIVHRYSLLAPGYILQGSLTIRYDEKLKAFRTEELFRIQSEMLTRVKDQPEQSELAQIRTQVRNLDFPRTGYFFARSADSYILVSKKSKQREHEPAEIQTIYFDNVFDSGAAPGLMDGILSDWHKKRYYSVRVVVQKLDGPLEDKFIRTLDPSGVNDVANHHLTRGVDVHDFVVSYA
jgi:hypothetical protein